ncbi:glycoside hydrolase family 3 N-terminal domain-containing protein [Pelagicoccus sp. SDUM812005]|uniref:glycoside hydrolase family 3 N-terminal domain-containing protein n=1 Tax=Pelagicoccus sp. SDUM812005 TaxID=3041257 RepID=UPI00280CA014|nr:glycoside hydrolase family 3 N-terminal domain-containing protein [Pelagicoccus sp. SDUM812005]MDQ8183169.1 glycoside hydrolase family 3 N-terminal domain-containing protein [Pelagicoccus sp. SDUM812005]
MTTKLPLYRDPNASLEARVEDLISRMTLAEKVAQVQAVSLRDSTAEEEGLAGIVKAVRDGISQGIGQIENTFDPRAPEESVREVNDLQRQLLEETRLGVPALIGSECAHGHAGLESTILPVPLAMASSWNPELVREAFDCAGREARARGAHEAHTPVLDLGRDPRWGRIEETFGEDTHLVTQMGLAAVSGLQGGCSGEPGTSHIISAPKHFAGYGQVVGGRNFAATPIDSRTLHEEVLPPFKAVVQEANALGMMASHCEVEGVPAHGNRWLLTDLLRGEWGFKGYVVSDYNDVPRLEFFQRVAESVEDACEMALSAGMDVDLPVAQGYQHLLKVIEERPELEEHLDVSVRRILWLKFKLGLFENPFVDEEEVGSVVDSPRHREIAERIATDSIVMLKNENELLPLKKGKLRSMAVLGPNAATKQVGNYTVGRSQIASFLEGLQDAAGDGFKVSHAPGCAIAKVGWDGKRSTLEQRSMEEEEASIAEAAQLAANADVAVVCVGGTTETSREAFFVDGIKGDRATLGLLGNQLELVRRVVETGTPTVVVLQGGRPYSIPEIERLPVAILNTFYLGQASGTALAKIVFGEVSPSGRLPVTVPRSVGQLPMYYSQKRISFYKDYLDEEPGPLYPFGFGLSYARFEYSELRLQSPEISRGEALRFSLKVRNVSEVDGAEVVQVYLRDNYASVVRPDKLLVAFQKVDLKAGEQRELEFVLNPEKDMSFIGREGSVCVEPGTFELEIGSSCKDVRLEGSFELLD